MCLSAIQIDLFLWLLLLSNFLAKRSCNQEDACLWLQRLIFHLLPYVIYYYWLLQTSPETRYPLQTLNSYKTGIPDTEHFLITFLLKAKDKKPHWELKFDCTYLHESYPTIPSSVVLETINCEWSLISPRDERAPPACHACAYILLVT